MKFTDEQYKEAMENIYDDFSLSWRERDEKINQLRRDQNFSLEVGDGATLHYFTDANAYTVIKRTPKMIVLQRDKAIKANGWKPEFIPGGFSAICINNEDQEWEYERDPEGSIIKAHWSEADGRFKYNGLKITSGRHEFYDYNF